MTIKADRIYWDSCVFIDSLQQTPGRYDVLREIVESAKRKETEIVTSAFSIAEVVAITDDRPVSPTDVQKIKDFFENEYIKLRQLDRQTVELAADIGRTHSIKPPDAVHIATALLAKCRELQTYDGLGKPASKKRMLFYDGKIGSPTLAIKIPSLPVAAPEQKTLDFKLSDAIKPAVSLKKSRRPVAPHPLRHLVPLFANMLEVSQRHTELQSLG